MNWFILVIAGLFEIGWAVGLKYTDGFTRLWPTVLTVGVPVVSAQRTCAEGPVAAARLE